MFGKWPDLAGGLNKCIKLLELCVVQLRSGPFSLQVDRDVVSLYFDCFFVSAEYILKIVLQGDIHQSQV